MMMFVVSGSVVCGLWPGGSCALLLQSAGALLGVREGFGAASGPAAAARLLGVSSDHHGPGPGDPPALADPGHTAARRSSRRGTTHSH